MISPLPGTTSTRDALITTEPLNPGTSYTIRLEKIASRAVEWTYQPPDLLESFERNPARSQKAPRKAPWVFNFNYAIDPKSFTQALRISPAVDYHVEASAGSSRFMVIPNQPLPSQTDYAIWFAEDLVDTGGSPLPALNPIHYTTPSAVSEFLPNDGNPLADIELFFDRDMDLQSTVAALTIQPPTDGTFEWEGAAHLVFHPNAGHLEEFTEYAISLAPTARDSEHAPVITKPITWAITTSNFPNIASFGEYGSNVQVVDKEGRRAIQIAIESSRYRRAAFRSLPAQYRAIHPII